MREAELAALLGSSETAAAGIDDPDFIARRDEVLGHLRAHRSSALRSTLGQAFMKQGLQAFVTDTVAPLNVAIGEAWMRGEIDARRTPVYPSSCRTFCARCNRWAASSNGRPRILLTTFPEELHALGLLMVEAMLVPEGAQCVSLGTQTPLADIRSVAVAGNHDVVALSFRLPFRHARQSTDCSSCVPPCLAR